jgi:benzoyl-CoA reductase/2-hydroxyglutaryl-CoA dehydratase subunit BcrC/BadD/HgdB
LKMSAIDSLANHLKNRLVELSRAKSGGRKIIGYTPGGYLPEELVLAAGAVPVGMIRGGDHAPVELSSAYICRWIDTFARAQIGYATSGEDPYYNIIDLLAIPLTDNHVRAISDVLDYNTEIEIFPFGVPHMKEPVTYQYYLRGITGLKGKLEEITGGCISNDALRQAIKLCNRERALLREISLTRCAAPLALRSQDFVALNHGAHLADKEFMVSVLEEVLSEIKEKPASVSSDLRLLLTGSTLALGDGRVLDISEEAGAAVVIEEFGEGIKPYWQDVAGDGDPMEAIAEAYFMKRVPPAWFRPGGERHDHLIKLARDFKADGVIWYELMYRESYKTESYYFPARLREETGLPMLVIDSDYDPAEAGQMRTRIETFVETLR